MIYDLLAGFLLGSVVGFMGCWIVVWKYVLPVTVEELEAFEKQRGSSYE